jgi:integrase
MDAGIGIAQQQALAKTTLAQLLDRYKCEVLPRKRAASVEVYMLERYLRHPMSRLALSNVRPDEISRYRDQRLKVVQSGTVLRELGVLRHVFEVARKDWCVPLQTNPVTQINLPKPSQGRTRRVTREEIDILLNNSDHPLLPSIIIFAIETGMRQGEIVNSIWSNIDANNGTLHIPITKTDVSRTIPLTQQALESLKSLPQDDERIFPISGNAVRLAWQRLKKRVGIEDLHFHDLRHEAISRFFEMGLSVPEVALISGHRDYRMLFRYTHLRAEDVAKKLASVAER